MSNEANMRSYSFKKLMGFRMTDADKQWYNENPGRLAFFHDTEVWTDPIPSTPPVSSTGTIEVYNTLTLTEDLSVSDHKAWTAVSGSQLTGFIPPRFGSGYFVAVYDNNDDVIVTSDASVWTFDYDNGVLWFENDPTGEGWSTPIKIKAYQYIGTVLNDASGSISATLDDVCENGATTDVAITVTTSGSSFNSLLDTGDLDVRGNTTISGDTYAGSISAGAITGTSVSATTVTGNTSVIGTILASNSHIYVNADGPDENSTIYFYEDSGATGAYLNWNDGDGRFDFSHSVGIGSNNIVNVADPSNAQDAATKNYVDTISGSIGSDLTHYATKTYVTNSSGSIGQDLNNQVLNLYEYVDNISGSIGSNLETNYATKTYVDTVSGSIGTDINNQVLNLYEYVDTVSGSCAQSLQGVTDIGSTTVNSIIVAGMTSTNDNSSVDTAYTPMTLYNSGSTPPAASGFTIGTLYIQYTP